MRLSANTCIFFSLLRHETDRIPTAAASLGLGIASLGWAMENAMPLNGAGQAVGAILASFLLVCIAGKFLLHPTLIAGEMRHPVAGSILPTFAMGLMVVSKAVGVGFPTAAHAVWFFAVALHLFFLAWFTWCHLRSFSFARMVPSWFVPPVGIITAALTCSGAFFAPLADALMLFGLVNFALLLPAMVYRLIFHSEIADAAKPTIAILAAPASLSLAGYLTVEPSPSLLLAAVLLGIALLMTAVIYMALVRLLRLPFSPGYAAFTFPLVISATALYKSMHLFASNPLTTTYAETLRRLATVELFVATLIVGYVAWLYVKAGSRALLARPERTI